MFEFTEPQLDAMRSMIPVPNTTPGMALVHQVKHVIGMLSYDQARALPSGIRDAMGLYVSMTSRVDSADALVQRIREAVHWHTLNDRPVSMRWLNRIFGRVAHRHGIKISDILIELAGLGQVSQMPMTGGRTCWVSTVPFQDVTNAAVLDGSDVEGLFRTWAKNSL